MWRVPATANMNEHPLHSCIRYLRVRIDSYMKIIILSVSITEAMFSRSSFSIRSKILVFFV